MKRKDDPNTESVLKSGNQDETDLLKKIIRLFLSKKEPVSLSKVLKISDDKAKISSVFTKHKEKFSMGKQTVVDLKLKVGICKRHCSKQRCSGVPHSCTGLHICKFYALSGSCKYGEGCSFGHDLTTKHNRTVLDKNYLTGISTAELNYLFSMENNRIVPEICKFYNVENNTCKHSGKETECQFLHICRHFVNGTCKFDNKCRRSHDILEDRANKDILQSHGIDTSRKPNEVLKELQQMFKIKRTKDESEVDKIERAELPTERMVGQLKKESVVDLNISLSSDSSDDDIKLKQEQMTDDESKSNGDYNSQIQVTILPDSLQFRYKSQLKADENKAARVRESKQVKNVTKNGHFAEVSITNYEGKALVLAYCVDCDDNIHPFNLHGTNCEDGVYKHECWVASDTPVRLSGDCKILTPAVNNYEKNIKTTDNYLKKCNVTGTNICKDIKDKQPVYLKVIVFLEDRDKKMISATSNVIQKKDNSKSEFNNTSGVKRAFSYPDVGEDAKRLRIESAPFQTKNFFESCYSGQNASTWSNFIDTSGYEQSALTWQAHGEALQSVCMIVFPEGAATGFRVGNNKNYIMTARHVVDHIQKPGLRSFRRTSLTSLKNEDVYAVFGYLKEGEVDMKNKFFFKDIIHFQDPQTDTTILELSDSTFGTPMPPPLVNFRSPDCTKKFYFIGHSEGKPLGINKVDKIVDMNSKESKVDIGNVRQLSLDHTVCPQYPQGRKYELNSVQSLTNKHRFLFHCKFTKGASGSPGIVCLSDGRKVVVTMLLCGYPEWYYDPSMEDFKANWSKDGRCVEQGVKLESLYKIMKKENSALCKDIFQF